MDEQLQQMIALATPLAQQSSQTQTTFFLLPTPPGVNWAKRPQASPQQLSQLTCSACDTTRRLMEPVGVHVAASRQGGKFYGLGLGLGLG